MEKEREREKRGETVRDSEWRSGAQGGREGERRRWWRLNLLPSLSSL